MGTRATAAKKLKGDELKAFLDEKVDQYNRPGFIELDPISIPHAYTKKQDIEIAGLFAAVLAWGQRVTIVRKCNELLGLMDNDPHQFILHHKAKDLKALEAFKHRTFNATDTLYFVAFLKWFYKQNDSLEQAFAMPAGATTIEPALINFHDLFFSLDDYPHRTRKHISTPARKSTCKRLSMYLRWMVRDDDKGVDFGLWKNISPAQLVCPCDLHVDRVGRRLKLIRRKQTDWQTALELTSNLARLDPADPVKYDFALFGLGIEEGWSKTAG
ncbi:TIGR02757 family protein [Chryseolinea lacunae]|uniref:TIGR02757 family protein n=1 Tax=Chryseolinea lacunae TaxID=2801331 RepID=A0ABS1KK86_9BACT|nr:TIGR02757 family protein [Chryseolinea lacunae]MBL0739759.1 TIGR02757 family protein [Chryseolinea lacunae]